MNEHCATVFIMSKFKKMTISYITYTCISNFCYL